MVIKNLFRRRGRTFLTLVGISIGVAAIVALGAVGQGLRAGLTAMTRGSEADLVLTQAETFAVLVSSVDEAVADELRTWPEVAEVDGVLFTNALMDSSSYVFVLGYDPEGFAISHFSVVEGQGLAEARGIRGRPLLLGRRAAQSLGRQVGDTLLITGSAFRIVGIYETGDGFEDGAAVIPLEEAQLLALQPRRVSALYVRLRDPAEADQLRARIERRFSDLAISTTSGFVDEQQMLELVEAMTMGVAVLAVVIGGVGMTNTLFMSVFERTREIGLLRSVGWRQRQVLQLVLTESLALALLGGAAGIGLGVAATYLIGRSGSWLGVFGGQFSPDLFLRAVVTAVILGLVGGAYPAWWASRLLPLEALRHEGGAGARTARPVPGGMTVRSLWRRRTRTALTLLGIGIGIGAIIALGGIANGMVETFTGIMRGSQTDLMAIEAGIDSDLSAIDERVGARIAARPDVQAVSGMIMTSVNTDRMPMVLVFGYHPREFAIRRFRIVEGQPLAGRRQVIVGRQAAQQMGLEVGDTLRLLQSNFRVVGIFETGLPFEEIGIVIGLQEAQALSGKPRQVQFYAISLRDPGRAEAVQEDLETTFPEIDFALTSELTQTMSDFRALDDMVGSISFLAVFIGAVGMLNTLLMSVLERTREIGVLRALGWRRRQVLQMILRESLILGAVGGVCGLLLGLGLGRMVRLLPGTWGALQPIYTPQLFAQALVVATVAGVVGGVYPAWRAARMRPVEALRHE